MSQAIFGYKTAIKNGENHEGWGLIVKSQSEPWGSAIMSEILKIQEKYQLEELPIITWFVKL